MADPLFERVGELRERYTWQETDEGQRDLSPLWEFPAPILRTEGADGARMSRGSIDTPVAIRDVVKPVTYNGLTADVRIEAERPHDEVFRRKFFKEDCGVLTFGLVELGDQVVVSKTVHGKIGVTIEKLDARGRIVSKILHPTKAEVAPYAALAKLLPGAK